MPLAVPTPFSALIFDCDGTLVDTAPAHFSAIAQALSRQGHSIARDWYMSRTGLTPNALLDAHEARLAAQLGTQSGAPQPLDRTAVYRCYDDLYRASLHLLQEVSAVADLARAWHGRVPMAVASNGHRLNVESSLRATGLLGLFDHLVAAEDVAHGKPAPDVFLEAARRMHVAPTGCLVLEDTDEGLAAANAAGMRAVDIRQAATE